jgi:catechol 2,3-dioxygenase-like lactoylglutathione lyase family enzyme
MSTLAGIAHASVVVSDMERALRFYRDLLGLVVTDDEDVSGAFVSTVAGLPDVRVRVVLLSAGDPVARVELLQFVSPQGFGAAPPLPALGASHVALLTSDIHALHRSLTAAGVTTVSAPIDNGVHWAMHVLDPDDIRVELLELIAPSDLPAGG